MGLLPPNASVSGRIVLDGDDILEHGEKSLLPHRWKDIAMVFQGAMNALNPVRTVGDQIREPMELHGVAAGAEARSRAGDLLELVGIPAKAGERFPHEFSGGMRQRASIAMALACDPKVLLADEPTTALDVMVQAQILQLLVRLTEELDLSLLLVTHDLPVVAQTCHRAAVMYAGRIAESGPVDDLYHEPRHPYTRLLFAATPDLLGLEEVVSIPGTPPALDRPLLGCPFHPRCDRAFDRCGKEDPELKQVGAFRRAACHLNDERDPVQAVGRVAP
jgi:oligopeptide/dipeptide ABC transporter ATP-binding protein